jgi:hypothetical protein
MLYTTQLSQLRKVPNGIEVIDITIKSAVEPWNIFAPTWGMVEALKDGGLTEARYKTDYINLMRSKYKENKAIFHMVIQKALDADVALGCYCPPNTFCHRMLVKEILLKLEPRLLYMGDAQFLPNKEQLILF